MDHITLPTQIVIFLSNQCHYQPSVIFSTYEFKTAYFTDTRLVLWSEYGKILTFAAWLSTNRSDYLIVIHQSDSCILTGGGIN